MTCCACGTTLLSDRIEMLEETIHRCPLGCYYLTISDNGSHEIEEFFVVGNLYVYGDTREKEERVITGVTYLVENHYQRGVFIHRRHTGSAEWSFLKLGLDALYKFPTSVPFGTKADQLANMCLLKGAEELLVIKVYDDDPTKIRTGQEANG